MNFRPLHDRIVILPLASEEKTRGGIIIPDNSQEKPVQGKVMAVGNGSRNQNGDIIPMAVQVGDVVMYSKWGGTEVKIDGQEVIIMKESDVIGILSN
jgi:chaperonin GroES